MLCCKTVDLKLLFGLRTPLHSFLLQGIFPTQGSNLGLPHYRQMLLLSEPPEKPLKIIENLKRIFVDTGYISQYLLYQKLKLRHLKPMYYLNNKPLHVSIRNSK